MNYQVNYWVVRPVALPDHRGHRATGGLITARQSALIYHLPSHCFPPILMSLTRSLEGKDGSDLSKGFVSLIKVFVSLLMNSWFKVGPHAMR